MKTMSLARKLTAWYALFLSLAVGLACFAFLRAAQGFTRAYFRDTLKSAAALARDEMYMTDAGLDFDANLKHMDAAQIAYFDENGELLYGRARLSAAFAPGVFREVSDSGARWAVYDEEIFVEGYGRAYLRACMPTGAARRIVSEVSRALLLVMPALLLLAAGGGFAISRRAMRPIKRIADAAGAIAGAGDLKKRIPVPAARDELSRLCAVFNDMLSRLDAAFERETRFTSDASHEMRTPVAAILAVSEAALAPGANREEALVTIREKALSLSGLIQKLLTLSRMDAGRARMEFERVNLADIVRGVAEEAGERFRARNVFVRAYADEVFVTGDQTMLTRLLLNLMENAYRHSPEGARISLALTRRRESAVLNVIDEGEGIDPESLPHIFDRFYRADAVRAGEGSGLGLPIARAIARAHGGDIAVCSEKGRFARFTVTLPVSAPREN